ncbi:uncharacterized protein LOC120560109 isoform X1 [Perca fluviatilis]|uniref:uncharacterized protein LOC120560109 isoform X1 n=1 Tax=Perca fluviatilis TaxID=8168 RepID=UPI001966A04E|nr:uncharacterized protein LOC120560109 isoform X1 [Perca fluviatilis]
MDLNFFSIISRLYTAVLKLQVQTHTHTAITSEDEEEGLSALFCCCFLVVEGWSSSEDEDEGSSPLHACCRLGVEGCLSSEDEEEGPLRTCCLVVEGWFSAQDKGLSPLCLCSFMLVEGLVPTMNKELTSLHSCCLVVEGWLSSEDEDEGLSPLHTGCRRLGVEGCLSSEDEEEGLSPLRTCCLVQGNTMIKVWRQLHENHNEEYLHRKDLYTTLFVTVSEAGGIVSVFGHTVQAPPPQRALPSPLLLHHPVLLAEANNVQDYRNQILSTFGTVLKMDSTKKVVTKLSGGGKGSSERFTSIVNEQSQIVLFVLTCEESTEKLKPMCRGVMDRFRLASQAVPKNLFVDHGCCPAQGPTGTETFFQPWGDSGVVVRRDIFRWMHRFDAAKGTLQVRCVQVDSSWGCDGLQPHRPGAAHQGHQSQEPGNAELCPRQHFKGPP